MVALITQYTEQPMTMIIVIMASVVGTSHRDTVVEGANKIEVLT